MDPTARALYAAEWYREPRDAEIAGYMPQGARPASGA
jgi:protein TonB